MATSSPPPSRGTQPRSGPTSPGMGLGKAVEAEEEYIFQAPPELVCPLTLSPFVDPVLTTAGHVYERSAIQTHLEHSTTDPLTRQPLLNKSLTPVYVIRARAMEYRESVAKACIQRACSGAPDPMRYLRRAVELIADTGGHVQGLSNETIEYILSHSSNAFDRIALQTFAQGLFQAGYKDRAAAIYGSLLLEDADRVQQADLLRCCLSCWTEGGGEEADGYVFQKLVALFEARPGSLTWDQLVELAQAAELGDSFVLRLCEQLLFRTLPPTGGGGEDALVPSSGSAGQEKRLLLKYVHVLTDSLQRRQTETDRRLAELEKWRRMHRGGGGGGGGRGSGPSRARSSASLADEACSGGSRGGALSVPGWLRSPALLAPCMFLAAALPPEHAAARLLRALPFLALLPQPSP